MSSSWGCMLLMDWKSDSTALSLVMLRPRMWLLFMRFRKVVTAFCRALRNCSWFSSDSPFWYGCWRGGQSRDMNQELMSKQIEVSWVWSFYLPPLCWQAEQEGDFQQAGWLVEGSLPETRGQGPRGWGSSEHLPASFPSRFYSGSGPTGIMRRQHVKIKSISLTLKE